MKKLFALLCVLAGLNALTHTAHAAKLIILSPDGQQSTSSGQKTAAWAYANRQSNVQVSGRGRVIRLLKDDLQGSRHQRFILRISPQQTLLIAHNIDLAPRINTLRVGDQVRFYGEYVWNQKGGILHWTHHDPRSRRAGGWLKHRGRVYD